mmetsp:Transcript_1888/g.2581  ORF Transcript_1888/g.2581 Transcript_1888/m.2581 type:complete len:872 (-) Transcript_1888:344-2959(-)
MKSKMVLIYLSRLLSSILLIGELETWAIEENFELYESRNERRIYTLECEPVYLTYGDSLESLPTWAGETPGVIADLSMSWVRKYRMTSTSWNEEQLSLLKIAYCEARPSSKSRWVKATDTAAALDSEGNCIVTTLVPEDSECNAEKAETAWITFEGNETSSSSSTSWFMDTSSTEPLCCERAANCYWEDPVPGINRTFQYTEDQAAQASSFASDYVAGLLYPAIPASFIACVVFVGAPIYGIFHLCCLCCRLKLEGYTPLEKWLPFSFFVLLFCGVALAFTWSLFAHFNMNGVVTRVFEHLANGISDTKEFLLTLINPLRDLSDAIGPYADIANTTLRKGDWIYDSHENLYEIVKAFRDSYANFSETGDRGFDLVATVNVTLETMQERITVMVDDFTDLMGVMKDEVLDVEGDIRLGTESSADSLSAFNFSLARVKDEMDYIYPTVDLLGKMRKWGLMGIFVLSTSLTFVTMTLMSIGATQCRGHKCLLNTMNVTWSFNWIITTAGFATVGALTVFFLMGYDACQYYGAVGADFRPYFGYQSGQVINSCLTGNYSLETALNLTEHLDFPAALRDSYKDFSQWDPFTEIAVVLTKLKNLDSTTSSQIRFFEDYADLSVLTSAQTTNISFRGPNDIAIGIGCYFNESYLTEEEILRPWSANRRRGGTSYSGETYRRTDNESALQYMDRHYNLPTICPDLSAELMDLYMVVYNNTLEKYSMRAALGYEDTLCLEYDCSILRWPYDISVFDSFLDFRTNITGLQSELTSAYNSLQNGIVPFAEEFQCLMDCTFVKQYYNWLEAELCVSLLGGMGQLGLCLYCMMFCNIPMLILTCMLVRRLRQPRFEKQVLPTIEDEYQIFTKKIAYQKYAKKKR